MVLRADQVSNEEVEQKLGVFYIHKEIIYEFLPFILVKSFGEK